MSSTETASAGPVYTLTAIPAGTLPVPGWEAFFGRNDHNFYDLVFYVWLVTDGQRTGLIDAGLPLDAADRAALDRASQSVDENCCYRDVRPLNEMLDEVNVRPEDIDFVLITQPITYHTGGLDPALLPRAEVYISKAGVMEMLTDPPGHPETGFYFTRDSWIFLRDLAVEGRLRVTDGPVEVAPGILFETTGGHHPGSAGVQVRTAQGLVGLLETAFLDRNVEEGLPIGIAEDVAACRSVIRRYKRECDMVVAVHDPKNAQRFGAGS